MADPRLIAAVAAAAALVALLSGLLVAQLVRRRRAERRADRAERQLRSIASTMRESIVAYDLDLKLQFVSPAFETLTGYTTSELRAQNFIDYIHPDDRERVMAEWESIAKGGSVSGQEYRILTRDGRTRWCSSSWEQMHDQSGRPAGFLGTELDITERKAAEEALRHEAELFQAVIEVQQAVVAAGLDSRAVMQVIVHSAQDATGASAGIIEMIEGEDVVPVVSTGSVAPRLKLATSLSGLTVRTGELQRVDDSLVDARANRESAMRFGIRSLLTVPLKADGRVAGVLKVISPEPGAFSLRDERALRLMAGIMGAALGHASAYESRQARLEERTRALQESEQRFKQLVDASQEGIWVLDDRGLTTYANRRMSDLLGYATGELLGRSLQDFLDPSARLEAQRHFGRTMPSTGEVRDFRFRRRDGSAIWTIVATSPIIGRDGALVGTVAMVTDITERKRAEDQLRRTADRVRMLHDIDQAILSAQSPAEIGRAALARMRRMVPCQRCTVVLYDFERAEAQVIAGYAGSQPISSVPMPLGDFSTPEVLRRGVVRSLDDLDALEQRPPMLEQLRADGLRSVISVPLLLDGEVIGELNLASQTPGAFGPEHRDIAVEVATPLAIAIGQARLREELRRQTGELTRRLSERTAELRDTTAELEVLSRSVAHDLRGPLRRTGGFAQLLLEERGTRLDPEARHYAERILEGTAQMGSLLEDLLTLTRIGRQDLMRRPTDLNVLLDEVSGQLRDTQNGRKVEWRLGELPQVDCDPGLARIALTHLLHNALKFSRAEPEAVIRVEPLDGVHGMGRVVSDNGVGFDMAHAGKLFGVFQRLHRPEEFEGNGIGLATVQRIAHRHGGRVWADAEPGHGASFFLSFGPGRPRS
jgi:PAS domain S-box-containing protein